MILSVQVRAVGSVWRYLRAGGITLLLLLGFVGGWQPIAPNVLAKLPARLGALAKRVPEVATVLLRPFAGVAGFFRITSEDWALFRGTGGVRHRLWIEARGPRHRSFVLLYRVHDPEHAYRKSTIEDRRVFNLWNAHNWGVSAAYPHFARWVAARIFEDYPHFREVRVREEQVTIRAASQGFTETGQFDYERVVRRDELRP
jgi:hypothetical protein